MGGGMTQEDTNATSVRLRRLEEDYAKILSDAASLEKQVVMNQVEIARLSERLTVYQLLQSAYTTAAATIATVIGRLLS